MTHISILRSLSFAVIGSLWQRVAHSIRVSLRSLSSELHLSQETACRRPETYRSAHHRAFAIPSNPSGLPIGSASQRRLFSLPLSKERISKKELMLIPMNNLMSYGIRSAAVSINKIVILAYQHCSRSNHFVYGFYFRHHASRNPVPFIVVFFLSRKYILPISLLGKSARYHVNSSSCRIFFKGDPHPVYVLFS